MDRHDLSALLSRLPHGEPFRFVDELVSLEPMVKGVGVWHVRGDEAFFRGHFPPPGEKIVPGVLIGEALAQVSGLVAFGAGTSGADVATPARLAQIDVKILAAVRPPAKIELASTFVKEMGPLTLFEVAALVNGSVVASGRVVLTRAV
jgi:3-hydroxyacyl-[acyl-carrier-protein] dehydratase